MPTNWIIRRNTDQGPEKKCPISGLIGSAVRVIHPWCKTPQLEATAAQLEAEKENSLYQAFLAARRGNEEPMRKHKERYGGI